MQLILVEWIFILSIWLITIPKVFNLLALLPTFSSPQMALLKQTAKLRYKIKYGTFPSDPATLQIQESFSMIQSLPKKKALPPKQNSKYLPFFFNSDEYKECLV